MTSVLKREVSTGNNRMDKFPDCRFGYFVSISGFDIQCTLLTAMKRYPQYFSPT